MEAIRNKYSGVKFMKVADLPELRGEVSVSRNLEFFLLISCSEIFNFFLLISGFE